jgi:ribosome biogenesis GTPase
LTGRIIKGVKDFFDVYVEEDGEYRDRTVACNSRGVFRHDRKNGAKLKPLVGDIADIEINFDQRDKNELWGIIKKIGQRKNSLLRPPMANLDVLFIVTSVKQPSPSYFFIDKLTVTAVENDITPVIIINKTDLDPDTSEIYDIYLKAGFKTIKTSAVSGDETGFDEIKKEMRGRICAFAGASGAGKSSILNRLFAGLNLDTGELSSKIERGKHTTRTVELFKHGFGGYAADTPGFGALDFENDDINNIILEENLIYNFPDFEKYITGGCKYAGCRHIKEEGCGIIAGIDSGEIAKSRHESYIAIYGKLKELNKNKKAGK